MKAKHKKTCIVLGGLGSILLPAQKHVLFWCFNARKKTLMLPIKQQVCHTCLPIRTDHWCLYMQLVRTFSCKIKALPIDLQSEKKTTSRTCWNVSGQIATKFLNLNEGHF